MSFFADTHTHTHSQDEGAFAIAEAISDNQVITHLELGSNSIGDKGAIAIAKVGTASTSI